MIVQLAGIPPHFSLVISFWGVAIVRDLFPFTKFEFREITDRIPHGNEMVKTMLSKEKFRIASVMRLLGPCDRFSVAQANEEDAASLLGDAKLFCLEYAVLYGVAKLTKRIVDFVYCSAIFNACDPSDILHNNGSGHDRLH